MNHLVHDDPTIRTPLRDANILRLGKSTQPLPLHHLNQSILLHRLDLSTLLLHHNPLLLLSNLHHHNSLLLLRNLSQPLPLTLRRKSNLNLLHHLHPPVPQQSQHLTLPQAGKRRVKKPGREKKHESEQRSLRSCGKRPFGKRKKPIDRQERPQKRLNGNKQELVRRMLVREKQESA